MINSVEVLIKGVGKLELDTKLSEEFGIPIIYSIDDINNYGKRTSTYSKTIKVSGSKNNNRILGQLYDIKIDGSFDMTIKHECVLTVNSNSIIDGFMVLNSINKYMVGDKFQIFYELNIFDEVKNLFDDLGESKLIDLDFSTGFTIDTYDYDGEKSSTSWLKGNHIFNEDNVISGYTTQFPYYYPIINYGYDVTKLGWVDNAYWDPSAAYKYNFPYYGVSLGILYPGVYIKSIFDKIFYDNGYTYTSNFLNGITYDNLFGNLLNIYNKPIDITEKKYCSYVSEGGWIIDNLIPTKDNWVVFNQVDSVFSGLTYHYYESDDYYYNGYVVLSGITGGNESTGLDWVHLTGIKVPADGVYKLNINIEVDTDTGGMTEEIGYTYEFEGERTTNFTYNGSNQIINIENEISDPGNNWYDQKYHAAFSGNYSFEVYVDQLVTGGVYICYRINDSPPWNELYYFENDPTRHLSVWLNAGDTIDFSVRSNQFNVCQDAKIKTTNFSGSILRESLYQFYVLDTETHISTLIDPISGITTSDLGGPVEEVRLTFQKTYYNIECKKGNIIYAKIVLGNRLQYFEVEDSYMEIAVQINLIFLSMELQEHNMDENFIDKYNNELEIAKFLPDMKQVDFLREIIKMFNLQIITDKVNNKNLIIEPRDNFYNGSMVDWSDKVDYNKPINIKSLNDKNYRVINLSYAEGKDYLNVEYKNLNGITYGNAKIETENNPLLESENVIELKEQSYLTRYSFYTDEDITCLTEKIDSTWFDDSQEYQPMIGIKTEYTLTNDQVIPFANLNTGIWNQYLLNAGQPFLPTCNFISSIGGKEYSLEFSGATENNLYTLFYKNQIENLQSKNCRYVTLYLNLKLSDILNLTFRKNILIDGQQYILQKIEYDVTKTISSKVELLKLVEPYNSVEPGSYDLMSIRYLPGDDDYFLTNETDRIRIN